MEVLVLILLLLLKHLMLEEMYPVAGTILSKTSVKRAVNILDFRHQQPYLLTRRYASYSRWCCKQSAEDYGSVFLIGRIPITIVTDLIPTSDDLTEGSTNLYFTFERSQDATGSMVTVGIQTGITVTYDDVSNTLNYNVTMFSPNPFLTRGFNMPSEVNQFSGITTMLNGPDVQNQ